MAGNGYANNIHSNHYYGYVKTSSSYTDCGNKYSNLSGNLSGTSKTLNSGTVFEPQDCDKGDIARSIFYMVARYNYYSGSDSDGIDTNNPNLALTQDINDWASSGYTSSTSRQGKLGIMTDLLAWHKADPVDEIEIHRNNLLYTNFTNNRNPFIDFPEWANFIWGSVNYNGSTYVSNNVNPTGYATPSSDTINGYNGGGEVISVTGVNLNKDSTSITVGGAETLEATIVPANATNQGVTWSSSDTSVATVSGGTVRGVAEGTATITVTTSDGGYTDTCSVEVTSSGGGGGGGESGTISFSRSSSVDTVTNGYSLVLTNSKANEDNYQDKNSTVGLDISLKKDSGTIWTTAPDSSSLTVKIGGGTAKDPLSNSVTASYIDTNGDTIASSTTVVTTKVVTTTGDNYTVTLPSTNNVAGVLIHHSKESSYNVRLYGITLTYESESATKTLTSIDLDTSDAQTTFNVGDEFNYNDLVVTADYDDGSTDIVAPTSVSTPDMSTAGQKTVTVTYTEGDVTETATYTITVNAVTLTSIEVVDPKTSYIRGETFVKPTVIANYSNGSTSDVTSSAEFSGYSMSTTGTQTVTVSYTSQDVTKTTNYQISVSMETLQSIRIEGYKTEFTVGDSFSFGGTAWAVYSNGNETNVTNVATYSGYDMSTAGTQTVTVSWSYVSTQYQITVKNVSPTPEVGDAVLYSGALTEGYYVIYYNGNAMKNTIDSNRLTYSEVTPTDDIISSPSDSIIWHIQSSGNYWTIYNEEVSKYAAGNGTKNQAALIDSLSGEDGLWSVDGTSTYEFVNKKNDTAAVNKNLRNNGSYGFACYSTNTGGALSLYRVQEGSGEITSITASVSKTFAVGETISTSDLIVKDNNNHNITGFAFANNGYQFTYADAASGGASTSKTFTNSVTYETFSCSLTVNVARTAYEAPSNKTYSLTTSDFASLSGTSSSPATNTITKDGVSFIATQSYKYTRNSTSYLSLWTTKGDNLYVAPGSIYNDNAFTGSIISVTPTQYGSTTIQPTIYYSDDKTNWSTTNNNNHYFKISFDGEFSGYPNFSSITVVVAGAETASNVANYVMYEDTANQCVTKFATASDYFGNMSSSERATFMTSNDYVIATARERFEAWARYHGKTISYENSDYIIKNGSPVSILLGNEMTNNSQILLIVIVSSLLGVSLIGGYFLLRKRKEQ